jgi:catechol 2,3-dioxygenase-like lactoylglutathione lyase family enzyme
MLTDCNPITFIPTKKPEAAKRFYLETLGLRFVSDDPFAIVFDLNGIRLRVEKVQAFEPLPFTILGWKVADIGRTIAGLTERGVRFGPTGRSTPIRTGPIRTKTSDGGPGGQHSVSDRVLPSGSLNHAIFAPLGAVHTPRSSCGSPS